MDPVEVIHRLEAMYEALEIEKEEQKETEMQNGDVIEGLQDTIDRKEVEKKVKEGQVKAHEEKDRKQQEVLQALEKEQEELEKILAALTNPDEADE